jgi:glutamate N-acetyltransferase / amino-acid N-acetyltransferase
MKFTTLKNGSVTDPQGFHASGMHCGIKTTFRKYDTALIVCDGAAVSAGTFTTSTVKAWPLLHDIKIIEKPYHRVIFANSGNANCFNGKSGKQAVQAALGLLSKGLQIPKDEIFVSSTGIIGRPFPVKKIERAIPKLITALSKEGGHDAARGILTTDTIPKEIALRLRVDGKAVTVAAMAKGAGMVLPEMNAKGKRSSSSLVGKHATMLCFITTDLNISKRMLQKAISFAVGKTFNRLVIDNDQSTNDTVLALASGKAGNKKVALDDADYQKFQAALVYICEYIALNLAKDGEGVRHVCEVHVKGAQKPEDAERLGRQIASSMLVKTMLAGEDPNWGRVMGCVGACNVAYSPKLDVRFDGIPVLQNGMGRKKNTSRVRRILKKKEFKLEVNLKRGIYSDRFWATDLTKYYVWINASYSS